MTSDVSIILGSNSPRRLELLSLIAPANRIQVLPPADSEEQAFEDVATLEGVFQRVTSIAKKKMDQLIQAHGQSSRAVLVTADTIVVATDESGRPVVLGKPDGPNWDKTVRDWFVRYYSGRSHEVVTAVCVRRGDDAPVDILERTIVKFRPVTEDLLNWYISTEEPLGKAGGYGLQGAGALFVESVIGSSTNVIGLPLEAIWSQFQQWNLFAEFSTQ